MSVPNTNKRTWKQLIFLAGLGLLIGLACNGSVPDTEPPGVVVDVGDSSGEKPQPNEFAVGSANTSIPSDVLEELRLFVGGGPSESPCTDLLEFVAWHDAWSTQPEYYDDLIMDICIPAATEDLSITLIRPDGIAIPLETIEMSPMGGIPVYYRAMYQPTLDDPEGIYRFQIEGLTAGGEVYEEPIELPAPSGPRMVWLSDEPILQLYNFRPNERVRLFGYVDNHLAGWQEYTVDSEGQTTIHIVDGGQFIAIGDDSGEVRAFTQGLYVPCCESILQKPN